MQYDIFISHASEDKDEIAMPLARLLSERGYKVWIDEQELKLGDSLRRKIDEGLLESRYGAVILSSHFFSKEWPQKELDGLVARETREGKTILPIWHRVTEMEIARSSPMLADKVAVDSKRGIDYLVERICDVLGAPLDAKLINQERQFWHEETIEHSPTSIEDLLFHLIDNVTYQAENGAAITTGVTTGFKDLDFLTGGLQAGSLYLLAGRAQSGKTLLALNIAAHVAAGSNLPVVYYTLDLNSSQIVRHLVGVTGMIGQISLRSGRLQEHEWGQLTDAVDFLRKAPLDVYESLSLTMESLRSSLLPISRKRGKLGLVVIDSLELMEYDRGVSDVAGNRINGLPGRLRLLSHELACPILLLSQLEDPAGSRVNAPPLVSHLAVSRGDIGYFDCIILLHHLDGSEGRTELRIVKNKEGYCGTIELGFDLRFGRYTEVELRRREADPEDKDVPF